MYKKIKNYEEAISFYHKALNINPNHADAHNNLGISFNELDTIFNHNKFLVSELTLIPEILLEGHRANFTSFFNSALELLPIIIVCDSAMAPALVPATTNSSVKYLIKEGVRYDTEMLFYPKFHENKV